MDALIFDCIWQKSDAPEIAMVTQMWRKYQALDHEGLIEKRSKQIVFVIKNGKGEVGGVSTVRPVQATALNGNFFYEFRCFITPEFRAPGLDSLLAAKTKAFLEQQPESVSKFKGLIMIVENEALRHQRTKAVWPSSGMVFAGYTPKGHHIRIGYFKGARI